MEKFRCIVVDPPWAYNCLWGSCTNSDSKGTPMPYSQMPLKEIKSMPVKDLAADNCDLYLWTTQKYLPAAFDVLKCWQFKYCQTLTWCKPPRGLGQGGLYCPTTEFLILGRVGKMPNKRRIDSTWFKYDRGRHSQKPEAFQDMIEKQSDAPRLELFARRKRDGWSVWGNEVDSDIHI